MSQDEASISVYDSGFLSGDSIFEGVRIYNGKAFKLDEHIDLLWDCAHALKMVLSFTREDVRNAVLELLRMNNHTDGVHVRIQVTRGKMKQHLMNPASAVGNASLVIYAAPAPLNPEQGVKIITSSIRRVPPDCLDQKLHTCNKVNSLLAKLEANLAGVAEALMLDINGFVAECATTNVFFIKDEKVMTPMLKSCKMGITRQLVIDGAKELGYDVFEKDLTLYNVYTADECFFCGTYGGLKPVIDVDGRMIGDGTPGPITKHLIEWYNDLTGNEGVKIYS